MLDLFPAPKNAARVVFAVELGKRTDVLAAKLDVMVHERLHPFDPELVEKIPEFHDVGQCPTLVIRVVADVAVKGLFGFIEELVKSADRRITRVLGHPRLDLFEYRQVSNVYFGVGLIAQRSDKNAAKGVQ